MYMYSALIFCAFHQPSFKGSAKVLAVHTATPCMLSYKYILVYFRIYLAALHFNENTNRAQAMDREGNPAFSICYPRAKQTMGGYTVRKVLIQATHSKCMVVQVFTYAGTRGFLS